MKYSKYVLLFIMAFAGCDSSQVDQDKPQEHELLQKPLPKSRQKNFILNSAGDTIHTGVIQEIKPVVKELAGLQKPVKVEFDKVRVGSIHKDIRIPEDRDSTLAIWLPAPEINDESQFYNYQDGDSIYVGTPISVEGTKQKYQLSQQIESLPADAISQTSDYRYITIDNGLMHNEVNCIFKDINGNFWIGGPKGVSCYNGVNIWHFTEKEGLGLSAVKSIIEDSDGNIWFGGDGGVSKFDGEAFLHYGLRNGLLKKPVTDLLYDRQGNLWICTYGDGVVKLKNNTFTYYPFGFGNDDSRYLEQSNYVSAAIETKQGELWFATDGGSIIRYDGTSFYRLPENSGIYRDLWTIYEDDEESIWIGSRKWLSQYKSGYLKHFVDLQNQDVRDIKSIVEDDFGQIWMGSAESGLFKFYETSYKKHHIESGLSSNMIFSLWCDEDRNLWIGTGGGGVSILTLNGFTQLTMKEGLNSNNIVSLKEDDKNNLWIGTDWEGLNKIENDIIYEYQIPNFVNQRFWSIEEDMDKSIWFGSQNGAYKLVNNSLFQFTMKNGLISKYIKPIYLDSKANLWIGCRAIGDPGGFIRMDKTNMFIYPDTIGHSVSLLNTIIEDKKGNTWFGSNKGLLKVHDNKVTHYSEDEGLPSNFIQSLFTDSKNNLWIGTNSGLSVFDGENFTNLTAEDGLSDNSIASFAEDKNGNIWVATYRGLNLLQFDDLSQIGKSDPIIHLFDRTDNMKGVNFNTGCVINDSKNQILWGSVNGITVLDMDKFKIFDKIPEIHLNSIEINETIYDYRNLNKDSIHGIGFDKVTPFYNYPIDLTLSHKNNHLTFLFSAIDWSAPQKIKYSFMIDGLDKNWSTPTTDSRADYRDLQHGNYTFMVKAMGASQKWSQAFAYTFSINPPWYKTLLFRFILLVLITIGIYFIFQWRTKTLRKRKDELQKANVEMTRLDHAKMEFLKIVSHEIRTPLNGIFGSFWLMKESNLPNEIRGLINMMDVSLKRLERFSDRATMATDLRVGNYKLRYEELKIIDLINEAIPGAKAQFGEKDIEFQIDIPANSSFIWADKATAQVCFTEIIANSVKYSKDASIVKLSSKTMDQKIIFECIDQGKGFDPETLEKVFDFLTPGEEHMDNNIGLSLAMINLIMEKHQGTIEIGNNLDKGADIRLGFPIR